ncbi:hypothetical protein F9U64_07015 [Gracilibacillus oryzae]|uniref:V-ATPase proteolipid subunit C-like domain-containing protein n=1 Tax=Gracilibacillus oryzae TaxID=1672701 RepID=A0A7C8GTY3_9BACI|nr:hypothetical protein [Gracilibacillus oryzae]KAB8137960.1 hypothetical protein F9U64_07015 [Gracilibacillus oryzae]
MLSVWAFTIAAIIAGIGILINFKSLINKLIRRIEQNDFHFHGVQKDQSKYFIMVAVIEAIPIFLFVLAFISMEDSTVSLSAKIIPLLIIIGIIALCIAQVLSANHDIPKDKLSQQEKGLIRTTTFVGLGTILAIPIASLILLFIV